MEIKLCVLAVVTMAVLLPHSLAQRQSVPGLRDFQGIRTNVRPVVVTPRPTQAFNTQCEDDLGEGADRTGETFDGQDYQLEPRASDETEDMDDEAYEDDFDVSEEDTKIDEAEMKKYVQYVAQREPQDSRSVEATRVEDLSPYHHYSIYGSLVMLRCCPRRQGYGCRSVRRRLGCFRKFGNQVCCPIWPRPLYQAYCNCHQCVRLARCATCGTCQRRYRNVRMWAVCRVVPGGSWNIRQFWHPVATSCYCRTRNWFRPWEAFTSLVAPVRG